MDFPEPPPLPPELKQTRRARSGKAHHSNQPPPSTMAQLTRVSVLGTNFAFQVGGGALLGWALDSWLGTEPWLLLGIALLALISAMMRFVKEARKLTGADQTTGPKTGPK